MDAAFTESVITQIYNAAAGRKPWEDALASVARGANAFAAHLLCLDKGNGAISFSHVAGAAAPESHLALVRHWHQHDPRIPKLLTHPRDAWMHCHEHFDDALVASHPFYQEFLIPMGGRFTSAIKLVDDDTLMAVLAIHRSVGSRPLGPGPDLDWLDRLRLHWVEAIAIYRHLTDLHAQHRLGQALLDQMHQPMLLVDDARRLRFANAAARAQLARRGAVQLVGDRLACSQADDDFRLAQALAQWTENAAPRAQSALGEGPRRAFVRLRGVDGGPLQGLSLSPLHPAETMGAFGPVPMIMVYLHDAASNIQADTFALQELFDLTPAEADVAARLSQGGSPEDVATQRGVAMATVRTQVQSLKRKIGAGNQADLIRRVLTIS